MPKRPDRTVLFLCTGNYFRSRLAELLFNHVAGKFGLAWKATSRGLALERGAGNVGPIAKVTRQALAVKGVRASAELERFPLAVSSEDFEQAAYIVAFSQAEHLPLVTERHAAWQDKVEFWDVDDDPAFVDLIEREVMDLVSRLMCGGKPRVAAEEPEAQTPADNRGHAAEKSTAAKLATEKTATKKITAPPAGALVRVGRETKGRRGKGVTTVSDIPLDDAGLQLLASKLKQNCGTGGTAKDGRIEIQGDQRQRIAEALEALGYRVKRVGG